MLAAAKVNTLEALMTKVHAEIRKNPVRVAKAAAKNPKRDHKKFVQRKLTKAQKVANIETKFRIAREQA